MSARRGRNCRFLLAAAISASLFAGLGLHTAADQGVFEPLLRAIPADPAKLIQLWINDYDAAARAVGIVRPDVDQPDSVVLALVSAFSDAGMASGPFLSGFNAYAQAVLPGLRARAGYDVRDVRASLEDLAQLPARRVVIALGFPSMGVSAALEQSTAWPSPAKSEYDGVGLLVWNPVYVPDFASRLKAPAFDELGRAAPLAFPDDEILSASSVEGTEAMVDASLGLIPSLWDSSTVRALSDGMVNEGVYSCMLTNDVASWAASEWVPPSVALTQTSSDRLSASVDVADLLRPFIAMGVGVGRDLTGLFMAVALVHADDASALDNMNRLLSRFENAVSFVEGKPWSTWFAAEHAAAVVYGETLLAHIPIRSTASAMSWINWFYARDSLLLFGPG